LFQKSPKKEELEILLFSCFAVSFSFYNKFCNAMILFRDAVASKLFSTRTSSIYQPLDGVYPYWCHSKN